MGQSRREDIVSSVPERYRTWMQGLEMPAVVGTAAACSELGVSPFELDRYLTDDPTLSVRGGNRGIAVHLLPPPPNIGDRIEQLLDQSQRYGLLERFVGGANG